MLSVSSYVLEQQFIEPYLYHGHGNFLAGNDILKNDVTVTVKHS